MLHEKMDLYRAGVFAFEAAKKEPDRARGRRLAERAERHLRDALETPLDRVQVLYQLSLILKRRSELETDPARKEALAKEAQATRQHALEATKRSP